jgi:2-hydroxy-6-oxonona-2,4-dienedioate hydrolase
MATAASESPATASSAPVPFWLDALGTEVRFRDVGGVRTRTLEAGSGSPIVVLHGIEASAENHIRNLSALAGCGRVIAPDLLGHGLTDKPDSGYDVADYGAHVLALMDLLEIERADVVGQSLGGWIGCWLALNAPERVGKLVLNTMAGLPIEDEEGWASFEGLVERSDAAMKTLDPETIRRRLEWIVADPATVTDELVSLRRRFWAHDGWQRVAPRVIRLLTRERYEPQQIGPAELERIDAPTLLVWTEANPVHGLAAAEAAVAHLPRGQLVVVDAAAHWPQFEQPAIFNTFVSTFLSLDAGGSTADA